MTFRDWFRRRRGGPSPELAEMKRESDALLIHVRAIRHESTAVSSSLRESRGVNHFAEGFRFAMGGRA